VAPVMGGMTLLFALASLGLPGMGNFIGEFLVLLGTYQADPRMAIPAVIGLVLAVIYALCMVFWAFLGSRTDDRKIPDLSMRELGLTGVLAVAIVCLGMYPQPVIDAAEPVFRSAESGPVAVSTVSGVEIRKLVQRNHLDKDGCSHAFPSLTTPPLQPLPGGRPSVFEPSRNSLSPWKSYKVMDRRVVISSDFRFLGHRLEPEQPGIKVTHR